MGAAARRGSDDRSPWFVAASSARPCLCPTASRDAQSHTFVCMSLDRGNTIHEVLPLLERLLARKRKGPGVYCVVRFPDSSESRWFDEPPTPGMRLRSFGDDPHWGKTWVVDEVLRSGRDMYTVFCVRRDEYVDRLRHGSDHAPDLQTELLELARRTGETVAELRRRRKHRDYLP